MEETQIQIEPHVSEIRGISELLTNELPELPADRPLRIQEVARAQPTHEAHYVSGMIHIEITDNAMRSLNNATPEKKDAVRDVILAEADMAYAKLRKFWTEMSL